MRKHRFPIVLCALSLILAGSSLALALHGFLKDGDVRLDSIVTTLAGMTMTGAFLTYFIKEAKRPGNTP